jgi:hypothetical protein
MKRYLICLCSLLVVVPALAVQSGKDRRIDYNNERVGVKGNAMPAPHPVRATTSPSSKPVTPPLKAIDTREVERDACVGRNVGMGNTFVWASKTNNGNYESMVEDTKNPENNACFVLVTLKSENPKIKIDESTKYFMTGGQGTCGNWESEEKIKEQILASKKGDRVGGTIAGVVGGVVLGVGAMELFGNNAIGGKVQGQKSLADDELLRSQMLAAGKEKEWKKYEELKKEELRLCDELRTLGGTAPECDK